MTKKEADLDLEAMRALAKATKTMTLPARMELLADIAFAMARQDSADTIDTPIGPVKMVRSGAWWASELPSFPGARGQGKTQRAAFKNLMQAVRDLADSYAKDSRAWPRFSGE